VLEKDEKRCTRMQSWIFYLTQVHVAHSQFCKKLRIVEVLEVLPFLFLLKVVAFHQVLQCVAQVSYESVFRDF